MRITLDNGVGIAYDDLGTGERTVLLTHGLGCDRTLMAAQVEHFSRRYRVLNVDLRGHGDSDAPEGPYHPDAQAEDLALLLAALGVERPILVGHSLGGVIGLRLEHLHPGSLSAIVALDSAIAVPEAAKEATPGIVAGLEPLDDEGYRSTLTGVLQGFFRPLDDPARREKTVQTMVSTPKHVFLSGWVETVVRCDSVTPLSTIGCPLLYVAAETSNGDLQQLRGGPTVTVGQTVGTGHFIQSECPDQVHAMVDRFLAVHELG